MSCFRVVFSLFLLVAIPVATGLAVVTSDLSPLLASLADLSKALESLATVGAIIVGAIWSYWLFVKNRQKFPRASVSHTVSHKSIVRGRILIHVDMVLTNLGQVLLEVVFAKAVVSQVLPLHPTVRRLIVSRSDPVPTGHTEIQWPKIASREVRFERAECEVEPGETQSFQFDFVVESQLRTLEVYSYVSNITKRDRDLAWDCSTFYDIR